MEENANVVVKLLIRRPECFGPALRGEGGQGLLVAMKEAIKISEDPSLDLPKIPDGVSAGYESPPGPNTALGSFAGWSLTGKDALAWHSNKNRKQDQNKPLPG